MFPIYLVFTFPLSSQIEHHDVEEATFHRMSSNPQPSFTNNIFLL